MASKRVAQVELSHCVSCGTCKKICPKSAITIWKGCFAKVNEDLCVGCGLCERSCPAVCINIVNREDVA